MRRTIRLVLIALLVFCSHSSMYAQNEQPKSPLQPLVSAPLWQWEPMYQLPPLISPKKLFAVVKKEITSRRIELDMPLYPLTRTGIHTRRVSSPYTVAAGSTQTPWSENIKFEFPVDPTLRYASNTSLLQINGAVLNAKSLLSRRNFSVRGSADKTFYIVLAGINGYYERENIAGIPGIIFTADFNRIAAAGTTWTGVQFGSFARNYLLVKLGYGYVFTEGKERYHVEGLPLDPLKVYQEQFLLVPVDVQFRVGNSHVALVVDAQRTWHQRLLQSPDPERFGYDRFVDTQLLADLDVHIVSYVHLFAQVNRRFGNDDSLLFQLDPPQAQVGLRFSFHKKAPQP